MTASDLRLLRATFDTAASDPQGFLTDFRRSALKLDPTLRPVLPSIGPQQSALITDMLSAALKGLDSAEAIPAAAQALAQRAQFVGLQPKHYGALGQAILNTLATHLGADFTDNVRAAWADAYVMFAEAMMARCYNQMELVA